MGLTELNRTPMRLIVILCQPDLF